MTPKEAVETIARHAIASIVRNADDLWEDYPEIGEGDWEKVVKEMDYLTPFPEPGEYEAAYPLLAERADDET